MCKGSKTRSTPRKLSCSSFSKKRRMRNLRRTKLRVDPEERNQSTLFVNDGAKLSGSILSELATLSKSGAI